jgi:hypothetical protein
MATDASGSQTLQSSQTSGSPYKKRAAFSHYGFLLVDSWCAYGVHLAVLPSLRQSLVQDSGTFIDSVIEAEQSSNAALTYDHKMKAGEKGFPRAGQRVLKTWPINSLWREFLFDLDIDDCDASNAEDQLNVFLSSKGWKGQESSLVAFMSSLQLWYYGMPSDKVRYESFVLMSRKRGQCFTHIRSCS